MAEQLELLPETVTTETVMIPLVDLPPNGDLISPAPSAALRRSVARLGVLNPIQVTRQGAGWRVLDGRRRIIAARAADMAEIPASVLAFNTGAPASFTVIAHATRAENVAADVRAIQELLARGASEHDIGQATGLAPATIKQRKLLLSLVPMLMSALETGQIKASVALAAAKLPNALQLKLCDRLASGKLTARDVAEVRRTRVGDAQTLILDQLPTPPSLDETWIERVRRLIDQALQETPADAPTLVRDSLYAAQKALEWAEGEFSEDDEDDDTESADDPES